MWLNLVERVVWDHQVAGSNPVIPTNIYISTGMVEDGNRPALEAGGQSSIL